jgi:hypothetical protein
LSFMVDYYIHTPSSALRSYLGPRRRS